MNAVDPKCGAARHAPERSASRAYWDGCRCPAAVAWHTAWLERRRVREQYRYRPSATRIAGGQRGGDIDPIAVERVRLGEPPAVLTVPERVAAAGELTRRGASIREIADRIGVTTRTVDRYRARLRAA